ncbi:MAG: SH3 domain-containing protein [Chloroflexaceae bacterium]|nr:SH3 domain-containing protein [Chloroflexaceae bacterium]
MAEKQAGKSLVSEAMKALQQGVQQVGSELEEKRKAVTEARSKSTDVEGARKARRETKDKIAGLLKKAEEARKEAADAEALAQVEQALHAVRKRANQPEDDDEQDLPVGIELGGDAWVRKEGGLPLNCRDAPGLQSNVQAAFDPGTQLTLVSGPHTADGYTWWFVQATDGRQGWVAGEELVPNPQ